MKKVIIFCMACCITAGIQAQNNNPVPKKMSYYIGPQASIAVGDLAKTHSLGVGIHGEALRSVGPNTSLGITAAYTYLFGKKYKTEYYEPGGGSYGSNGKYKGASDVTLAATARQNLNERNFVEGGVGACIDFDSDASETAGFLFGLYGIKIGNTPLEKILAAWLGVCGDPKIQIGLRFSIKL